VRQFEGKVILYSELNLKSDFRILNWIGFSPPCARLLDSLAPS
jgi:hypothetical protein